MRVSLRRRTSPKSCRQQEVLHALRVWLRLPALSFDGFFLHQIPDFVDLLDEKLVLEDVGIVFVELCVDNGLDAAWSRRHHRNAIGQINSFLDVVRHKYHRLGSALPDAQQFALHQPSGLGVERAERFVHQKNLRIEGQSPRDRRALFHSARQLGWIAVLKSGEADQIDKVRDTLLALVFRLALPLKPIENVAANCFPWKQSEMLKHDATVGAWTGDVLAIDATCTGFDRQEATDQVEQG